MIRPYEPSGRVSVLAAITIPIALAVIAAAAVGYGFVRVAADVALVNGIASLAAMVLSSFAIYAAARWGRIRHRFIAAAIGMLGAAVFVFATHFGGYQLHPPVAAGQPGGAVSGRTFAEYLSGRADTGWTVPGGQKGQVLGTVRGGWIIALWVLEAILALLGFMIAGFAGASLPFCESCGRHAIREKWKYPIRNPSPATVLQLKKATALSELLDIEQSTRDGKDRLEYVIKACRCAQTASLGIRHIWFTKKAEKRTDWIFSEALLDAESLQRLYRWAEQRDPSMARKRADLALTEHQNADLNSPAGSPEHGKVNLTRWTGAGMSFGERDNNYLRTLRSRLENQGDYEAAETAIAAQRDANDRAFVVQACADWPSPPKWLAAWALERPDSTALPLVRGANGIVWAWKARGTDWTPKDIDGFWQRLRRADDDLRRAAELRPDDAVPWALMITAARGLQLGRDEAGRRFKESLKRDPGLAHAYTAMLSALTAKWGGSHEEMFRFAREASRKAPPGSAIHAIVAEAHLEMAGAAERDQGKDARRTYWRDPRVLAEVQQAAEKCFRVTPGRTMIGHAAAALIIGAALDACGDKAAAARLAEYWK